MPLRQVILVYSVKTSYMLGTFQRDVPVFISVDRKIEIFLHWYINVGSLRAEQLRPQQVVTTT
jgi:hypothetical protein